jgi:hypothetical protein
MQTADVHPSTLISFLAMTVKFVTTQQESPSHPTSSLRKHEPMVNSNDPGSQKRSSLKASNSNRPATTNLWWQLTQVRPSNQGQQSAVCTQSNTGRCTLNTSNYQTKRGRIDGFCAALPCTEHQILNNRTHQATNRQGSTGRSCIACYAKTQKRTFAPILTKVLRWLLSARVRATGTCCWQMRKACIWV